MPGYKTFSFCCDLRGTTVLRLHYSVDGRLQCNTRLKPEGWLETSGGTKSVMKKTCRREHTYCLYPDKQKSNRSQTEICFEFKMRETVTDSTPTCVQQHSQHIFLVEKCVYVCKSGNGGGVQYLEDKVRKTDTAGRAHLET